MRKLYRPYKFMEKTEDKSKRDWSSVLRHKQDWILSLLVQYEVHKRMVIFHV
jgi:hypothetical protein